MRFLSSFKKKYARFYMKIYNGKIKFISEYIIRVGRCRLSNFASFGYPPRFFKECGWVESAKTITKCCA